MKTSSSSRRLKKLIQWIAQTLRTGNLQKLNCPIAPEIFGPTVMVPQTPVGSTKWMQIPSNPYDILPTWNWN